MPVSTPQPPVVCSPPAVARQPAGSAPHTRARHALKSTRPPTPSPAKRSGVYTSVCMWVWRRHKRGALPPAAWGRRGLARPPPGRALRGGACQYAAAPAAAPVLRGKLLALSSHPPVRKRSQSPSCPKIRAARARARAPAPRNPPAAVRPPARPPRGAAAARAAPARARRAHAPHGAPPGAPARRSAGRAARHMPLVQHAAA